MLKRKKKLCKYSSRHLRRLTKRHTNDLELENPLLKENQDSETNDDTKNDSLNQPSTSSLPVATNSATTIISQANRPAEEIQSDSSTHSFQHLEEIQSDTSVDLFNNSGSLSSTSSSPDIEYDLGNDFTHGLKNLNDNSDTNFQSQLASWALSHQITHTALGSLIEILKKHPCHLHLPNDPRTLLKTPRSSVIRDVPPGIYYHFGVESEVRKYIQRTNFNVDPNEGIQLVINIDGLPISKSSTSAFWPILASLFNSRDVFMVGLYFGTSKPADCKTYLDDFIKECDLLTRNGLVLNESNHKFSVHLIVCDAPAKSLILCTKSHVGYSSCPKCYVIGEYAKNRVCFPSVDANLRSDEDFLQHKDEDYHTGRSPLEDIPSIKLVSHVPFDYMHVVCLGVVKKLIRLWLKGPLSVRIGRTNTEIISKQLTNLRKMSVPKEFVRKPRSLEFVANWKATEYRQFLLYSGPVVLKKVLKEDLYDHFVSLHTAIRIMCSKSLLGQFADYSRDLMKHFVTCFTLLYGKHYISHNIHALIHLPDDAQRFGVLDEFSAFKFENFMQQIKGQLRKSDKPLQQIIRRYFEKQHNSSQKPMSNLSSFGVVESSLHNNGPLPANCEDPQYSAVRLEQFYLNSLSKADNCCGIRGGKVVEMKNIAFCSIRKTLVVIGNEYKSKVDLFVKPCSSSLLNIYVIDQQQDINIWPLRDVICKYMRIPMGSSKKYTVMPLLHNDYLQLDAGSKPYLVVEFPDGVQLVAAKWVTGINSESCYWPNFTSNIRYDNAVKNLENIEPSWKIFPIKSVVAAADTFEKGKQKLREAESFSDVNSGYDTDVKKRIRRDRASKRKLLLENEYYLNSSINKKSIEDNVEESSESDDGVLLERQNVKKSNNLPPFPIQPTTCTSPFSDTIAHSSQSKQLGSPKSTNSTPSRQLGSPKKSPFKKRTNLTEFEVFTKKSIAELKYKVNSLLATQLEILEELRAKKTPTSQTEGDNEEHDTVLKTLLPLTTQGNLAEFEEKLLDNKFQNFVVKELRKTGGTNIKAVVFNVMQKIIRNELAEHYSWVGGKGKNIFSTLRTVKVIMEVVRLHHPEATDVETSVPIKNWLRHAKERKDRLKKKGGEDDEND